LQIDKQEEEEKEEMWDKSDLLFINIWYFILSPPIRIVTGLFFLLAGVLWGGSLVLRDAFSNVALHMGWMEMGILILIIVGFLLVITSDR